MIYLFLLVDEKTSNMDHNNNKIDNKGRKQKTFDKIFITESSFFFVETVT